MNREERAKKMIAALKAAGPHGLTGAQICEAVGIVPNSPEAHRLGAESIYLSMSVRINDDKEKIYIWAGAP